MRKSSERQKLTALVRARLATTTTLAYFKRSKRQDEINQKLNEMASEKIRGDLECMQKANPVTQNVNERRHTEIGLHYKYIIVEAACNRK